MPQGTRQQSETERDEAISKALGTTAGITSFAGLLGIPVGEFVRQQIFGDTVLKGMANNRAGKDLEKVGGSPLSRQKIATPKKVVPGTKGAPDTTVPSKKVPIKRAVRQSASDPALQKQIQAMVQKELDRIGNLTSGVTQTADYALNPNATNKSISRNKLKVEKAAGALQNAEYPKKVEDFNFAQQAVADAEAKAAAARGEFVQGYTDLNKAKSFVNPMPSATEQDVMDKLTARLNDPAVKRQRDNLLSQRRRIQADLGPRPKVGRSKQSQKLVAAWDAKNPQVQAQVQAINDQIAKMDAVIAPSGTLRPKTSNVLSADPMSVTRAVAGNMGSPLTAFSPEQLDAIRQGPDLSEAKFNVDLLGRDYGRAQAELQSAQRDPRLEEPQFYTPTRGQALVPGTGPGMPQKLVDFEVPNPSFSMALPSDSPLAFPSPMGFEGRGTANTGSVFPVREPAPQITIDDLVDPTGLRRDLQSYNTAARKIVPDYGNEQRVQNTARLMGNAAIKKGTAPKERSLIDRVMSMLQGGSVSPSAASNAGNVAQNTADNALAIRQFTAGNKGKAPDLSSADDVAKLQQFGWNDPSTVRQSSLVGNAENDIVSTRKLDVPRTRIGMNSAAARSAEELGLGSGFGSRSFNPELFKGKPNLGKIGKIGMGTGALASAGVFGYNLLDGARTEREAKAEAAKAEAAKTESKGQKLSTAERARQFWIKNLVARPENLRVTGKKLYDQLVLEAMQEGYDKNLKPEEWKQIQTTWFTLAKEKDRSK
jgi:hypothetical protein